MVCFCDLPLSRLQNHIHGYKWNFNGVDRQSKQYGKFGLGMSKEWGTTKKLNPVTYIQPDSHLLQFIRLTTGALYDLYFPLKAEWENDPNVSPVARSYYSNPLTRFMAAGMPTPPLSYKRFNISEHGYSNAVAMCAYLKPYRDPLTGQQYYDEREWRYVIPYTKTEPGTVPPLTVFEGKLVPVIGHEKGIEWDIDMFKKNIERDYMLTFNPSDVKYIIVESDSDIHDIITLMKGLPDKYTSDDIDRLVTRIITCEQLKEDF